MITYTQVKPDYIQSHEIHADGSYTSGGIKRGQLRKDSEDNDYSPWDELDPNLVTWLAVPVWQAEQDAKAALLTFKNRRQALLDTATVEANGFIFDADEISIGRLANAILATLTEQDSYVMQWSLSDTEAGVMTDVTLADLKLAHQLAVLNMSSVWSV